MAGGPEPKPAPRDGGTEREILSEGVMYALVDVGQQALALVVLPALLFFLSFEEFGVVTWAVVAAQIAMSVATGGLDLAVMRYYLTWDSRRRPARVAGAVALSAIWSAVLAGVALFTADGFWPWPPVIGCWAGLLLGIRAIPLAVIRVSGALRAYAVVVLGGSAVQAVAELVFVLLGFGAVGYMAGYALGAAASTALALMALHGCADWRGAEWRLPVDVRRFALGVWPSVLGNRLLVVADRLVLAGFGTLEELGLYGAASRLTTPVKLLSGGFKLALAPALSRGEARGIQQDVLLSRLGRLIVVSMLFVGALLAVCVWFAHFTPWAERAADLQQMVALLLVAQLLGGLAFLGQVAMYYGPRPQAASLVVAASATTVILGLVLLVPRMGGMGAAAAQVLSGLAGFVAVAAIGIWRTRTMAPWHEFLGLTASFLPCVACVWLLGLPGQFAVMAVTLVAYGSYLFTLARRLRGGAAAPILAS